MTYAQKQTAISERMPGPEYSDTWMRVSCPIDSLVKRKKDPMMVTTPGKKSHRQESSSLTKSMAFSLKVLVFIFWGLEV